MVASVAAGNRTDDSLAYGVAPGARLLLVRNYTSTDVRLHSWIEGFLETLQRDDVDVITDSTGIMFVPDTASDFAGLLFRRMAAAYAKPIFHGAGNRRLRMSSVSALGGVFSVGGSLGPRTFEALYGWAPIERLMVHTTGAAGPPLDGTIKPDFLAPMHRVAAGIWSSDRAVRLPAAAPAIQLPPGYTISCCTSASAPYAAGVAAVLLSAARQQDVPHSLERLTRALRVGAKFLEDVPAHQQGNGVLDVNAAWRELQNGAEMPGIRSNADITHPLAQYAARGNEGAGIFEHDGWTAGMTGRREIRFRRESGTDSPVRYRVSWTGNDGTFASPATLTLPLGATVSFPVTIAPREAGAHSALLNLHDEASGAIVFRTQATVVAAEPFDARTQTLRLARTLGYMRERSHFVRIPGEVRALTLDLDVTRGPVGVTITPGDGIYRSNYSHVYPLHSWSFMAGRYTLVVPDPAPGTWRVDVTNVSAGLEQDRALVNSGDAQYALTVRLLAAGMRVRPAASDAVTIELQNLGAPLREPAIETSSATLRSHTGHLAQSGLPATFDIDVPAGAATLALRLERQGETGSALDLHLYDCTSGECFSHDFTLPAAAKQSMVVRRPKPGRWVAAVNAAPFPMADGGFVLEEIVAMPGRRHPSGRTGPVPHGTRWTETIPIGATSSPSAAPNAVILFELLDLAVQRDEAEQVWETRAAVPRFRQTPAAIGATVHHMPRK